MSLILFGIIAVLIVIPSVGLLITGRLIERLKKDGERAPTQVDRFIALVKGFAFSILIVGLLIYALFYISLRVQLDN